MIELVKIFWKSYQNKTPKNQKDFSQHFELDLKFIESIVPNTMWEEECAETNILQKP